MTFRSSVLQIWKLLNTTKKRATKIEVYKKLKTMQKIMPNTLP